MDDKSHQWFGATVHSSGENGVIVVSKKIFNNIVICFINQKYLRVVSLT